MAEANEKRLKLLATALEMEDKGYRYYGEAIQAAGNELGRQVFTLLRDYEVKHKEKIAEIHQALLAGRSFAQSLGGAEPTALGPDLTGVFHQLAEKHRPNQAQAGQLEALQVGIDFEISSIELYEELGAAAGDPLEKKFAGLMVAEERGHLNLLTDYQFFLTDPEGWLMAQGRAGLDGA